MTQSPDYQKLRQAREQYEAIPVPPELSVRLEETIARYPAPAPAKQQPAARTYRWRMPAIAAACMLAVLTAFNLNPSIAQAVQDVPLLGTISRICTIQSWTQQDEVGSIIVQQPALNGSSALAQSINAEIEQAIANAQIKAQMEERMAADQNASYFDAEMGGFTTITAETPFYINQASHPVITFEKCEIAPGFMGQQEFEIVLQ